MIQYIKYIKGNSFLDVPLTYGDTLRKKSLQVLLTKHYNAEIDIYYNTKNPFISIRNTESI
jgi:hypothetical protein